MGNFFIARPTTSDAATVTASSEADNYPATNLQVQQPRDYFRSADDSDFYLTIDLGAAVAVNVIALLYTNADTSTQWRIRGATSEANLTAAPGYDSTVEDHWPDADLSTWDRTHAVKLLSTPQSYRWWRIDISGLSALDYYQAGRLYIDAAFNPTRTMDAPANLGRIDQSIRAESENAVFMRQRKQRRTMGFTLSLRTESEAYTEHLDLQRRIGAGGDLLVQMEGSSYVMERLMYCSMDTTPDIEIGQYSGSYSGNIHSVSYNFTELEHP